MKRRNPGRLRRIWLGLRRTFPGRSLRIDPKRRATLVVSQWLDVQHYVAGAWDRGEQSTNDADQLADSGCRLWPDDSFIPRILRANEHFGRQEYEPAAQLYREVLEEQSRIGGRTRRFKNPEERRDYHFRTTVVALLRCSLAQILAARGGDLAEVDALFKQAIDERPQMTFVRRTWADELVRRKEWEKAQASYEVAFLVSPSDDARELRNASLAYLANRHAQALAEEEQIDAAIEVLREALGAPDAKRPPAGHAGMMRYTLADLYRKQERSVDAIDNYDRSAERYHAAGDALSEAVVREVLGDYLLDLREDARAIGTYQSGLDASDAVAEPTDKRAQQRRFYLKLGVVYFAGGHDDRAADALRRWRDIGMVDHSWNLFATIATEGGPLLRRPDLAGLVGNYLDATLRQATSPEDKRLIVEGIRSLWKTEPWSEDAALEKDKGVPDIVNFLPVMTPLSLEVDSVTLDALGDGDRFIKEQVPRMRAHILERYGVKIPGIRIRDLEAPARSGSYVILIHEVPRSSGVLDVSSKVYLGSDAALSAANIGLRPLVGASGLEGSWIAAPDLTAAEAAGLELLEPADYLLRHLEETVVSHLLEFVAHQEVQNLLDTHKIMRDGESYTIMSKEAARHMDPLSAVVRSLVVERVPIVEFKKIYARFAQGQRAGTPLAEIVEGIRVMPEIAASLWGNDGSYTLFEIGRCFEAEIQRLSAGVSGRLLIARRDRHAQLMDAIKQAVSKTRRLALVIGSPALRALVRGLVAKDHPDLPVLSRRELGHGRVQTIAGQVELPCPLTTGPGRPDAPSPQEGSMSS